MNFTNSRKKAASFLVIFALAIVTPLLTQAATENAAQNDDGQAIIDRLVSALSEAGRKKLPATPLRPEGHELAEVFLKPLAGPNQITRGGRGENARAEGQRDRLGDVEEIMKNRFSMRGMPVEDLGFPYDWFRAPHADMQWPTGLSRHRFIVTLANAYASTGEQRYADKAAAVLLDWVAKFPVGGGGLDWKGSVPGKPNSKEGWFVGYWDGPWISLSVANRVKAWLEALPVMASANCMNNRTTAILLNSMLSDAPPILIDFPRLETGNQYLTVLDALLALGFSLPDFKGAADWRQIGLERIKFYASNQVYPDGSWAECAPNYGIGSLTKLFELSQDLQRRGVVLPPVVAERVQSAIRYFTLISDPAGRSPRLAEGGNRVFETLKRLNKTYSDPEVAWVTSGGKEGKPPAKLNFDYNWAGHFVIRSGWGPDDTWLFFEPGPRGSGHADKAQNNLQLISNGDVILADPGYYSYSNAGEENRVARYLDSARAHNTGVVDGKDQLFRAEGMEKGPNKAAGNYYWADSAQMATAQGAYTFGYGVKGEVLVPVVHSRRINYLKKSGEIEVEDTFDGDGRNHVIDVLWQTHPSAKVAIEAKAFTIVTAHVRTRFEVESEYPFEITTEVATRNPYSGWYSDTLGDLQPSTTIRVTSKGSKAHLKTAIKISKIETPQ